MTTARGLAKTYLRYWNQDNHGNWNLADNAPAAMHHCVRTMPLTITRNMAYEAFRIVAGQSALERPTDALLRWIADNMFVTVHIDNVLAGKNPPRQFAELVEKAYAAEMLTARNHVTSCLEKEILL